MSRLQIRVQDSLHQQVEEHATRLGLTISEYVVGAIFERLQRDIEMSNRIKLTEESRDWFFEILEDTSALPNRWKKAAKVAQDIEE